MEMSKGVQKELICPYWIVQSDQDRNNLERKFGQKIQQLNYSYPYKVGKERSLIFQSPGADWLNDFIDEEEGVFYKYSLQSFVGLNEEK